MSRHAGGESEGGEREESVDQTRIDRMTGYTYIHCSRATTERTRAEQGLRRLGVAAEAGDVVAFLGVCARSASRSRSTPPTRRSPPRPAGRSRSLSGGGRARSTRIYRSTTRTALYSPAICGALPSKRLPSAATRVVLSPPSTRTTAALVMSMTAGATASKTRPYV